MRRLAFALLLAACSSVEPEIRKEAAPECRTSSDCGPGQVCSRGICEEAQPILRCVSDNECPAGQACVSGYCERPRMPPPLPPR